MGFQPRMHNRIEGFSVLGGLRRLSFDGMTADLWDVACASEAGGYYLGEDPRLFIVLSATGAKARSLRLLAQGLQAAEAGPSASYVPGGLGLWGEMREVATLRHLDLHISLDALTARLGDAVDPDALMAPRLMQPAPELMPLAGLLAAECETKTPLLSLYAESLALALLIGLLRLPAPPLSVKAGLAPWALRRVVDFIEAHCTRTIRLEELSGLAGLSSSHFCHAFKASTGMGAHRFQMEARLVRAKALLRAGGLSISEIAADTGFADQAHFTRAFRRMLGTTPARWARMRAGD
ncbi:AraC family transcriptional regulator [Xaviernesmea oryzae]|uniref:AraC family transcriptional regulator n=1 Tax=Xaviernesmea oryzae TaxID=464029 RepID=A0A1Q9AUA5_9HYPH|nr:AraC family transcriptional regulator [Xaviernesmea oryzae]OLP59030.1 AraC family transcriptional regulator [Xaviernesmea oryzae]SEK89856.1 AraC-type DNA-binding protein [Xaviernesmea oryzae]